MILASTTRRWGKGRRMPVQWRRAASAASRKAGVIHVHRRQHMPEAQARPPRGGGGWPVALANLRAGVGSTTRIVRLFFERRSHARSLFTPDAAHAQGNSAGRLPAKGQGQGLPADRVPASRRKGVKPGRMTAALLKEVQRRWHLNSWDVHVLTASARQMHSETPSYPTGLVEKAFLLDANSVKSIIC